MTYDLQLLHVWKVRFRGSDRRQPLYRLMFSMIHLRSSKNPISWNHTRWYSIGAVIDFKLQYERAIVGGVTDGTRSLASGISPSPATARSAKRRPWRLAGAGLERRARPSPVLNVNHRSLCQFIRAFLLLSPSHCYGPLVTWQAHLPSPASLSCSKGCLHWRTSTLSWTNCPTLIGSHAGS